MEPMTIAEQEERKEKVKALREAWDLIRRNKELIPDSLNTMHRTEQQMVMGQVIGKAVKHFAKVYDDEDYCGYDGRNEVTVKLCSKIVKENEYIDSLPLI